MQFGDWLWQVLHGDLGTSIFTNLPVTHMIAQRIEPTLSLMVLTLIFSLLLAVPLGVIAAWKARHLDRPRRHDACGVRLFGAGVRASATCWPISSRCELDWLPVQGYTPIRDGLVAVAAQPGSAGAGAGADLHGADRAHHPRDDAGGAEQDYIRTAQAKGVGADARSCSCTR